MSNNDDNESTSSMESSDEALLDMLGLSSLNEMEEVADECDDKERTGSGGSQTMDNRQTSSPLPDLSDDWLDSILAPVARDQYANEGVFRFPEECSIPAKHMRVITEEIVWGESGPGTALYQADRTYEGIKIWKDGEIKERKTLTRLENFVDAHPGWNELCHGYLRRILSAALGDEMVLFKEKLNLKPPGGSGFAPHLDTPSLRIALGSEGPKTFCTLMVAIDDMTIKNGCLRICKGNWTEDNCCDVIQPDTNGNPDAGGRAGAIDSEISDGLNFEDMICKGGTVMVFNGWAPHRSSANLSPFPRRAIFLTYNPKCEGEYHTTYYEKMEELRSDWREKNIQEHRHQRLEDKKFEMDALSSVPK
jgi:hypothetical protein